MTELLNTKDYLKTRQFIEWDQVETQEKIKSIKENPKRAWWHKLIKLRRWFTLNKEQ